MNSGLTYAISCAEHTALDANFIDRNTSSPDIEPSRRLHHYAAAIQVDVYFAGVGTEPF